MGFPKAAVLVALAACTEQLPDTSFSSYCNDLSTVANTWSLAPSGDCGAPDAGFPMRFDQLTPQPCGDGCACQLSGWTWASQQEDVDFTVITYQWCQSGISCTIADGGILDGGITIARPQGVLPIVATATLHGACELDLTGTPP